MRSSGRKWGSFLLAVMLVLGMFAQGVPANAWQVAAPAESGENGAEPEAGETWDGGMTALEKGDYFAITTVINGHTWALGGMNAGSYFYLYPYDPEDIRQLWREDEHGSLQWLPASLFPNGDGEVRKFLLMFYAYSDAEYNGFVNFGDYSVDADRSSCDGYVPVKLDPVSGRLQVNDYENKLAVVSKPVNDPLAIGVFKSHFAEESERYKSGKFMQLNGTELFLTPTSGNVLTFQKAFPEEAPQYPHFVDYKLEDDWKITYNPDGTYNVEISCRLNFPLREKYDTAAAALWCGDDVPIEVEIAPGGQELTIRAENLPDNQETVFYFVIDQYFVGEIPESASGWKSCNSDAICVNAEWLLYEATTAIPVKKLWADGKDHSGDSVDLCLMENGRETSYTVTLNEEDGWQGAFKHVPYERWTYPPFCGVPSSDADVPSSTANLTRAWDKIPLDPRGIYTIVETGGTPGYAPTYGFAGPTELTPGQSYPVQAVFTPDDGTPPVALEAESLLFEEYTLGKSNQRFFLNGDHMLVAKLEDESAPFAVYGFVNFEKNDAGKYCLYMMNSDGEKEYFPVDNDAPLTTDKSQAAAIAFWNFETGEALEALPENSFRPVKTLLQVYEDGQETDQILDLDAGFSAYDPENPYQKFTVCCCDGQFVVFCEADRSGWFGLLDPCEGAPGEYMLRMVDMTGDSLCYVGKDPDSGAPKPVEQKEEALHFVLADPVSQGENTFGKVFTVTNTPLPPASLEVSKTVSGGGADQNKEFAFTVTLDDTTVTGQYGDMEFENGVATFTLKHGEKKTAAGLLDGIAYEVAETDNAGYTVTVNGSEAADGKASGTLTGGETVTLAFNNDKPEPPTEPSEPSKPSDPSDPSEPSKPSEPSNPSEPSKPSEPSDPSKPSEPSKPTDPAKPTEPDAPKTGDETNMGLLLCIMGVSLAGIVLLAFLLLKKNYSGKYLK